MSSIGPSMRIGQKQKIKVPVGVLINKYDENGLVSAIITEKLKYNKDSTVEDLAKDDIDVTLMKLSTALAKISQEIGMLYIIFMHRFCN